MDALGVADWARCAAFLSKELKKMVPQDVVISCDDFSPTTHPRAEVRSHPGQACCWLHFMLASGVRAQAQWRLDESCLQSALPRPRRRLVVLFSKTDNPVYLQPAVPPFFQWLNARLSSVRVLNVECNLVYFIQPGESRWAWPFRARLAPPPVIDGAAPLCAVRLVALPAYTGINAQSWLSSVASCYQQLTALCLRGFNVLVLPVIPQLRVLIYGYAEHMLNHSLLESVACQPRLMSLQLIGKWPHPQVLPHGIEGAIEGVRVVSGSILRVRDITRLVFLRLDVTDFSCAERMALPMRCSGALTLTNPAVDCSQWNLCAFTSLHSVCIQWWPGHRPKQQVSNLLEALPVTVESVDVTYPERCRVSSYLRLPHPLKALRLRVDGGCADDLRHLRISLLAGMQRLTLQLWGFFVSFPGPQHVFESLTDMHVEATHIDLLQHLGEVVQEKGQLSTRVPDKSELYGGGGGQPVHVAHMGPWPPSNWGFTGPDVPEARACCYWPCACGACETCCEASFWRAPGSG